MCLGSFRAGAKVWFSGRWHAQTWWRTRAVYMDGLPQFIGWPRGMLTHRLGRIPGRLRFRFQVAPGQLRPADLNGGGLAGLKAFTQVEERLLGRNRAQKWRCGLHELSYSDGHAA